MSLDHLPLSTQATAGEALWRALRHAGPDGARPWELSRALGDDGRKGLDTALRALMRTGAAWSDPVTETVRAVAEAPDDAFALGIDFEAADMHRRAELDKLERMRRFVFDPRCRHAQVLAYFGEDIEPDGCPGCDRCDPSVEGAIPGLRFEAPNAEELLLIRKALAGTARAEGRFGLRKVAGMLAGSKAKGVGDTSLASLSTFGLLKPLGTQGCSALLQLLVNQGLCQISGGRYPLLEISRNGWEVMQGRATPGFRPPPDLMRAPTGGKSRSSGKGRRARPTVVEVDSDDPVVQALRSFRSAEASQRSVPPYVVFNDRTLAAIAEAKPRTEAEFVAVHGLGPGRWSSFGQRLLDALADVV